LIPGPDLYALTSAHLDTYLGGDGIHPNHVGSAAMNNAWYLAMRDALEAGVQ
jgi:lysophospholipase L1-like esterase